MSTGGAGFQSLEYRIARLEALSAYAGIETDKVRVSGGVPVYGPKGEMILSSAPVGANVGPGVGRYTNLAGPQQDAHLRSGVTAGSNLFLETIGSPHLCANLYTDGATWYRFDTGRYAWLLVLRENSYQFELYLANPGANPIGTWSAQYQVSLSGWALAVNPPRGQVTGGSNLIGVGSWSNLVGSATPLNTGGALGGGVVVVNPIQYTCPVAGLYHFEFDGRVTGANIATYLIAGFRVNGSASDVRGQAVAGFLTNVGVNYLHSSADIVCGAGGYVNAAVYNSSGANQTIATDMFSGRYVSP